MKVSQLGEFGLVELIAATVNTARDDKAESWRNLKIGIGDDAAAWNCRKSVQLATTDSLVENIHFTLDITDWASLGWKSLAVNLSDIAAMGGTPLYALVSLAVPPDTEVDDIIAFYRGMLELANKHGIAIIGGDTDSTPRISITVTALGEIERPADLLKRSAARPGDLIAVTGALGSSAAGYEMLSQNLKYDHLTSAFLKNAFSRPEPRVDEGRMLVKSGVKAAIDISDGLVSDMKHVCKASKVGARINTGDIPISPEVKSTSGENSISLALGGGEDYELLFTGSAAAVASVKKQATCPVTVIGEIIPDHPGEVLVIDSAGRQIDIQRPGWEHFRG